MEPDIFSRDMGGLPVSSREPEFAAIREIQLLNRRIQEELNCTYHEGKETRELLERLTGRAIDETVDVWTPFYTDFGRNIRFGKDVFVNINCTFMDRGGITIEDGVFIGPEVKLITLNHDLNPKRRHVTICKSIRICREAWVGAGAMIMPGVTVGEGAVVAAGAVVTKDVHPYTVVAGIPAKMIEMLIPAQDGETCEETKMENDN